MERRSDDRRSDDRAIARWRKTNPEGPEGSEWRWMQRRWRTYSTINGDGGNNDGRQLTTSTECGDDDGMFGGIDGRQLTTDNGGNDNVN